MVAETKGGRRKCRGTWVSVVAVDGPCDSDP